MDTMASQKIKNGIMILVFAGMAFGASFLISHGWGTYNSIFAHSTTTSGLEKFALFSSLRLNVEFYSLSIENIHVSDKSADVSLTLVFSTQESTDENVIIVAQNPCDLEISENSGLRGNGWREFKPTIRRFKNDVYFGNKTCFWYKFQAESDCTYTINFKLYWENYLSQVSYSKFNLVIPISLELKPPMEFNVLGFENTPEYRITPDIPDSSSVSVHLPPESTNIYVTPVSDIMTYEHKNLWHHWDVKSRSDPDSYTSTAISINFESDVLLIEKESKLSSAGISIAIGAGMLTSLAVSLFLNYIKSNKKRRRFIGIFW